MDILFLKIFVFVVCLIICGVCLKIGVDFLAPVWLKKKSADRFKPMIDEGLFDLQTITRSLDGYIPAWFQNSHPYQKQNAKKPAKKRDLAKAIDLVLENDSGSRYILLLAESGAGKTSFILNYYLRYLTRPQKAPYELRIIPMGLKNAEDLILSSPDPAGKVLILDGFDEEVTAFSNPRRRLAELLEAAGGYRKVIVTCHLNFLPNTGNTRSWKGFELIPADGKNSDKFFELKKLYLAPLALGGVKKIIHRNLPAWKTNTGKQIIGYIKEHSSIGFTPLILTYMTSVFKEQTALNSRNEIYHAIIETWVHREKSRSEKSALKKLLNLLAVELYTGRTRRFQETISQDDFEKKAETLGIELKRFVKDDRSLVTVRPNGTLAFSHRSFLEYLFVRQILEGNKKCFNHALSDSMKIFFFEAIRQLTELDLTQEFQWLSRFKLTARGLNKVKPVSGQTPSSQHLLKRIISNEKSYRFLGRLNTLLHNPIFYEFGWNPQVNSHLHQAVYQGKTSLVKFAKKKWVVLIDPKKIEIDIKGHHKVNILINQKDFEEYQSIEKESALAALHNSIRMPGLRILNAVNQSGAIAVVPNLNNFSEFIIYFPIAENAS